VFQDAIQKDPEAGETCRSAKHGAIRRLYSMWHDLSYEVYL